MFRNDAVIFATAGFPVSSILFVRSEASNANAGPEPEAFLIQNFGAESFL